MHTREVMQLALDALTNNCRWAYRYPAIEALKAELAKPEPEPVAWISTEYFTAFSRQGYQVTPHKIAPDLVPLYRKDDVL
jgi:hypothetical protein